jgi:sodium/hydrogen antiporter
VAIDLLVFGSVVVAWTLVSRRANALFISAPFAFVVFGFLLVRADVTRLEPGTLHLLAEITLVLLLFHDASQVRVSDVRRDAGLMARLLLVGLPLTIGLGWLGAELLFPELGLGLALLLASALAPTDAGLGAPTVLNPVVPVRIRRLLNVESGLNDGLATPVVLVALALASSSGGDEAAAVDPVLRSILIGVGVGVALGWLGALVLSISRNRGWSTEGSRGLALAVLPILAYVLAGEISGNGFIAAFVAGLAFAAAAPWLARDKEVEGFLESASDLTGFAVWFIVGGVVARALDSMADPRVWLFALLALTAFRMIPVWLSLLGTGLRPQSVLFIGWFGPRGLASIIFALLAIEELASDGELPADLQVALGTILLTVLISVVAHGFSGGPLAERYGAWCGRERPPAEAGTPPAASRDG